MAEEVEPPSVDNFLRQQGNSEEERELEAGTRPRREWTDAEWAEWNQWWWTPGDWSQREAYSTQVISTGVRQAATSAEVQQSLGDSHANRRQQPDPWEWQDPWSRHSWWKGSVPSKGDFSDPPAWPGWTHYRLWKKAVLRWNQSTDVLFWRRSEKILKSMEWDLQSRFEHVADHLLQGPDYLDHVFAILDILAGEKETTDMRRNVRASDVFAAGSGYQDFAAGVARVVSAVLQNKGTDELGPEP